MGRSAGECARGTSQWVPSSGWPCGFVLCEVGERLTNPMPYFSEWPRGTETEDLDRESDDSGNG